MSKGPGMICPRKLRPGEKYGAMIEELKSCCVGAGLTDAVEHRALGATGSPIRHRDRSLQ